MDGWLNIVTGVGHGTSKRNFRFTPMQPLDFQTLEALYHEDSYAARICDAKPTHALRQGFKVVTGDPGQDSAIAVSIADLDVSARLLETAIWGNVFGGSLMFAGADDGRDPGEPLDWKGIRSIRFLTTLDRWEAQPRKWFGDALSVAFGEPSQYMFQRNATGGGAIDIRSVHASRVIRFNGATTSRRRRQRNQGWHDSVILRVFDKLQQFNGGAEALATLLQDSSQTVVKIKNLAAMLASDNADAVKLRLQIMDSMRSVARAMLIDADGEDVSKVESGALTGVADVFLKTMMILAGAVPMPLTVLMGQSPAGMNATGESDMRIWYDDIQAYRNNVLAPRAERTLRMILRAKDGPTGGREPANWKIVWPSLLQLTPQEEALRRKTTAETDKVYIDAQVYSPEECALSRFPVEGWSAETSVDIEAREMLVAADAGAVKPDDVNALAGDNGGVDELGDGTDATTAVPNVPAKAADAVLNAAQIEALSTIMQDVAERKKPREEAIEQILASYPITREEAERIMGRIGRTFFVGETAPVAP